MKVGFRWLSGDATGITDLFNESDLNEDTGGRIIEHELINETGAYYGSAICLLKVNERVVTLNYNLFPDINLSRGMILGVTKLFIVSEGPFEISEVLWKDSGSEVFEPMEFEFVKRKSRSSTWKNTVDKQGSEVSAAMTLTSKQRLKILALAPEFPSKSTVTTTVFQRSPLVVAEALYRAAGICERCGFCAPFISRATGLPYLEVHHKVRLADCGRDTIDNAIALCPNCHRAEHFSINNIG